MGNYEEKEERGEEEGERRWREQEVSIRGASPAAPCLSEMLLEDRLLERNSPSGTQTPSAW